jgi:hypothetical protein
MYRDKLSLEEALYLENIGKITILDPSKETNDYYPYSQQWKTNYSTLRSKFRHIDTNKFLTFIRAQYVIEIPLSEYEWGFVYGIQNLDIKHKIQDNIEYIYVFINDGYPNIVKIGMTERTVEGRARSLNASSTVTEWVPKFALPVSQGNAFRVEQQVHKFFSDKRVSSNLGNEREFFQIDPLTAFDKVREIGSLFQIGNPIVY